MLDHRYSPTMSQMISQTPCFSHELRNELIEEVPS
jgi:hypothetical protein